MDKMNARFAKRGWRMTALDYALVATLVVQTIFVIVTVSGNS